LEPEASLSYLEGPSICLDSEPDKSNQFYLFISLFHIYFNIILPPTILPSKRSFPPKPAAHSLTQTPSHAISSGTLQYVFCPRDSPVPISVPYKQQLYFVYQTTGTPEVLKGTAPTDIA